MLKKITTISLVLLVISVFFYFGNNPQEAKAKMKVYMTPNCGCCKTYSRIMNRNYDVDREIVSSEEMKRVKQEKGVPPELYSCHTTIIENYVVEGHVPMEAIEKLRKESPEVGGIGMADMPQGSPGMPGKQIRPFKIYEISSPGKAGELFLEL